MAFRSGGRVGGLLLVLVFAVAFSSFFQDAFSYNRPPRGNNINAAHLFQDITSSSPQQVHISLVGLDKMRITWITIDDTPATVSYGTTKGVYNLSAMGSTASYKYLLYRSGNIHDVVIGPLTPNTVYYYSLGSDLSAREFSFKTPPTQFPIKFVVAGDLGQTEWTKSTLDHIGAKDYDLLILPGDLSYADFFQPLWDVFGHFAEPLASQRPWMVTHGNHEVEKIPLFHKHPFTAYNARWRMPFEESGSGSNLYYSFEVAGVHVIMLGSYAGFETDTDQYKWLQADLAKVDRKKTPWLIALIHAPWYSSNSAHQGEYESVGMKSSMEELLYGARVDIVFAGHVHAYERFTRVYKDQANNCGPVHITIGDGGNREGLASKYMDPKPNISMFREASFGHARLEVVNGSHALWNWHRNDDHEAVVADSVWLKSLSSDPACSLKV